MGHLHRTASLPERRPHSDDPNFNQLKLGWVRKITPFDVEARRSVDPDEARELDDWLANLGSRRPFVSFQRSRDVSGGTPGNYPAIRDYLAAFRAFRAAHPQVLHFTAWNEPNHSTQPLGCPRGQEDTATCDSYARRAGIYYRYMRDECNRPPAGLAPCTVLAGDFLDDTRSLTKRYINRYIDGVRSMPRLWAYHAYTAGRRRTREKLSLFMRETRGDVWLTEQGGVFYNGARATPDDRGATLQAADTD